MIVENGVSAHIKEKVKNLTEKSGVYVMRSASLSVIYVGKAKNLKNRVKQYFSNTKKPPKVEAMVANVYDFDYYVTLNERDALALENNLIKKHQPFYNILLKDDKTYPFIKIATNKDYPTIEVVRKVKEDKAKYFGPFISGINPYQLIKAISYAYPIRRCKINITEKPKKPCLYHSLGMCSAPCAHLISKEDYKEQIKNATAFLSGNDNQIEKVLRQKMEFYSNQEKFEIALEIRDMLKMINSLKQKVVASLPQTKEIDVFSYVSDGVSGAICTLVVRYGKILGIKCQTVVDATMHESETISQFIFQFYQKNKMPNIVLTNVPLSNAVEESLQTKVTCPQKGVLKKLVETATLNATEQMQKHTFKQNQTYAATTGALENLKAKLKLTKVPNKIECYDISHISGTNTVASMVVFENGKPNKKLYRKFKIENNNKVDDFESLKQALSRRLNRVGTDDVSFGALPQLFVIDGGKGQLSSVMQIFKEKKIVCDVISLAKREEEVFLPNQKESILLNKGTSELKILQNIRDEAHRFAITFHRSLRGKKQTASALDGIFGLGEIKKKALLKTFENITQIKKATEEELAMVQGINLELARKIKQHLNSEK